MADLFKKLNTLVKATINDTLGGDSGRQPMNPVKLGKDIDREIAALRGRINDALDYETNLKAKAQSLQDEAAKLDQQADDLIAQGKEDQARYVLEQRLRAQQRAAMAESDLREHRLVTQELIERVNTLEAAVADARRSQSAQADDDRSPGKALSDVLREAREKIAAMSDLVSAKQDMAEANMKTESAAAEEASAPTSGAASSQQVEDDLARRRERLSKPK
jgi:phage shock protein A